MFAPYTPTSQSRNRFGRVLTLALAVTVIGLAPQAASALDFTVFDVKNVGNNQWFIEGAVDAQLEIGEYVTIVFGGDMYPGQSTTTTAGGEFEYYFEAYPGDVITLKASRPPDESPTVSWTLIDDNTGPVRTLNR